MVFPWKGRKMTYKEQFEPCVNGVDLTFDGVGKSNTERKKHLYPYQVINVFDALSAEAMRNRISIVDKLISKNSKLTDNEV